MFIAGVLLSGWHTKVFLSISFLIFLLNTAVIKFHWLSLKYLYHYFDIIVF